MTNESTDPLQWFAEWPHDKVPLIDKWREVHFRFGLAAQRASTLETDLVLLLVDLDTKSKGQFRFEDSVNLINYFAQDVRLLGRLIDALKKRAQLEDAFAQALNLALKQRNYLIHHFYRTRSESFKSPDGCDEMMEELVTIRDDIAVALDYLHDYTQSIIGSKMNLDDVLSFIEKHGRQFGLSTETILERYKTMSAKIPEEIERAFRGNS
ncbi:MAG: hypothetical protein M5U15_14190 [Kiritimatiellae bacterium]|nr:hypothetical protein [Kiritimatiellia bacterium]